MPHTVFHKKHTRRLLTSNPRQRQISEDQVLPPLSDVSERRRRSLFRASGFDDDNYDEDVSFSGLRGQDDGDLDGVQWRRELSMERLMTQSTVGRVNSFRAVNVETVRAGPDGTTIHRVVFDSPPPASTGGTDQRWRAVDPQSFALEQNPYFRRNPAPVAGGFEEYRERSTSVRTGRRALPTETTPLKVWHRQHQYQRMPAVISVEDLLAATHQRQSVARRQQAVSPLATTRRSTPRRKRRRPAVVRSSSRNRILDFTDFDADFEEADGISI